MSTTRIAAFQLDQKSSPRKKNLFKQAMRYMNESISYLDLINTGKFSSDTQETMLESALESHQKSFDLIQKISSTSKKAAPPELKIKPMTLNSSKIDSVIDDTDSPSPDVDSSPPRRFVSSYNKETSGRTETFCGKRILFFENYIPIKNLDKKPSPVETRSLSK